MISRIQLQAILLVDTALTGATGLLMLAGAWFLNDLLDLPTKLLWISGLILVLYAGFLLGIKKQSEISFRLIGLIALINLGWGIGCLAMLFANWTDPKGLGVAFVLLQVAVVFAFAALQMNTLQGNTRSRVRRLSPR